jgi:acetolactate synthase-1/2/3 large subunit
MLGMHGTYEANMTMQHCDVLLAVGARFDDRVIGNPKHFAQSNARSSTSTSIRRRSPSA